jgi:hypothetical protein
VHFELRPPITSATLLDVQRIFSGRIAMHLLVSREYPVIDYQTMTEFVGHERLFRDANGAFLLHMSSEGRPCAEERIIRLIARDAISWLNQEPEQFGSFWEFAGIASAVEQSVMLPSRKHESVLTAR